MKNVFKKFLIAFACILFVQGNAQIIGNEVYTSGGVGNQVYHNYNHQPQHKSRVMSHGTSITVTSSILMNVMPNMYMLTLGVSQEALTVKDCNTKINNRIEKLKNAFKSIQIMDDDLYVDFITQTKIYDYKVTEKQAAQFEKGFEIKKNVIVRIKNIEDINAVIELSAAQEIYDIIKVDYINSNEENIYDELYKETMKIVKKRKENYTKHSNQKFIKQAYTINDNFYSLHPRAQYKQYIAAETSSISVQNRNYSQHYIRTEARKHKTHYYDGMQTGFDKIINKTSPKVGIQYVMTLTVVYKTEQSNQKLNIIKQ